MKLSLKLLSTLIGGALLSLALWGTPLSAEGTCRQACLLYRGCVVEHGKKQSPPRTASRAEFEKLYAGCMKMCGLHKAKVLACYEKSKNSCPPYWVCIQKNYKKK